MPVCRCGRHIRSGRLCDQCALAERGARTDDVEHDCPECDGPTSGPDTVCANCRRVD